MKNKLEELLQKIATNEFGELELPLKFDEVAFHLLLNSNLIHLDSKFFFTEIEFYFLSEHYNHHDPYCDAYRSKNRNKHRQGKLGLWYLHRYKDNFHNRIRLDITFGSALHQNWGGILIRGIIDDNYHNGPNRSLKAITNCNKEFLNQLKEQEVQAFNDQSILYVESRQDSLNVPVHSEKRESCFILDDKIIVARRVGLKKRHDDHGEYQKRFYRYIGEFAFEHEFRNKASIIKELEEHKNLSINVEKKLLRL